MKISVTALCLLTLVTGCSVFSDANDAAPAEPTTTIPERSPAPEPAPPPLVGEPRPSDLDESLGVFVVADAAPAGDGTRVHPFATIGEGIAAARPTQKRVYVCEGTYREAVVVARGVTMIGGLDCSVAAWATGTGRSRIEAPSSPAVTAANISTDTRFSRFDVIAPDATTPSGSSIALFATSAGKLAIDDSRFVAGNGASGADGVEPPPTVVTGDPNGRGGMSSREYCWWTADKSCWNAMGFIAETGAAGGLTKCNGVPAGAGGLGGSGGVYESVLLGGQTQRLWTAKNGLAATYGASASGGAIDGESGSGSKSASFTREGYVPGDGAAGTNGSLGMNGAGGRGAPPSISPNNQTYWYGTHGSGGGAGGCGGVAGTPGKGGGASIAAYVVDGAVTFTKSELVAKNGGDGGRGTFGSLPTAGGKGGPMIDNVAFTNGQDGTAGGYAGTSGSGAGGASIALVHFGAQPALESTKLTIGQPGRGVDALTNGTTQIDASARGEAVAILAR